MDNNTRSETSFFQPPYSTFSASYCEQLDESKSSLDGWGKKSTFSDPCSYEPTSNVVISLNNDARWAPINADVKELAFFEDQRNLHSRAAELNMALSRICSKRGDGSKHEENLKSLFTRGNSSSTSSSERNNHPLEVSIARLVEDSDEEAEYAHRSQKNEESNKAGVATDAIKEEQNLADGNIKSSYDQNCSSNIFSPKRNRPMEPSIGRLLEEPPDEETDDVQWSQNRIRNDKESKELVFIPHDIHEQNLFKGTIDSVCPRIITFSTSSCERNQISGSSIGRLIEESLAEETNIVQGINNMIKKEPESETVFTPNDILKEQNLSEGYNESVHPLNIPFSTSIPERNQILETLIGRLVEKPLDDAIDDVQGGNNMIKKDKESEETAFTTVDIQKEQNLTEENIEFVYYQSSSSSTHSHANNLLLEISKEPLDEKFDDAKMRQNIAEKTNEPEETIFTRDDIQKQQNLTEGNNEPVYNQHFSFSNHSPEINGTFGTSIGRLLKERLNEKTDGLKKDKSIITKEDNESEEAEFTTAGEQK